MYKLPHAHALRLVDVNTCVIENVNSTESQNNAYNYLIDANSTKSVHDDALL